MTSPGCSRCTRRPAPTRRYTVCNAISNLQNNVFDHNTYRGPWTFYYFNQGDTATPAEWQAGIRNVEGSGDNFGPQDVHSTFS